MIFKMPSQKINLDLLEDGALHYAKIFHVVKNDTVVISFDDSKQAFCYVKNQNDSLNYHIYEVIVGMQEIKSEKDINF